MARALPPVIPEIAKAYQNDPRTRLALEQMLTGGSTAPVAAGKWAWADGIARAIQGAAGGYATRKQNERYGADEAALLALREKRGQDGLTGLAAPAAPSAAPVPTPQPEAPVSAPLAAPQGMTPPSAQMPPSAPMTAVDPDQASKIAAALGAPPPASQGAPLMQQPARGPQQGTRPFLAPPPSGGGSASRDTRSYKSAAYNEFEAAASAKHNVPAALIAGIRLAGERSNADQVSSSGARSVYQFIPSTRKRFMDKYGVDPWAGPAQAAEAAAIHLRESLDRNNGDVRAAVGEYIGGPNRNRWGKTTRSYIARVTRFLGDAATQPVEGGSSPDAPPLAQVPVPELPQAVTRPDAPTAEGPTQSRTLNGAYRIMADGNRYESAAGQDMYGRGLEEQSRMDESAAERRQRIKDMGYQNDLGRYANNEQQLTGARIQDRAAARDENFNRERIVQNQQYGTSEREASQGFQSRENVVQRAWQSAEAATARQENAQARLDQIKEGALNRKSQAVMTPTYMKLENEALEGMAKAQSMIDATDEFEKILKDAGVQSGGAVLGNIPGAVRWSSTNLQRLEAISNELALTKAEAMKGALSDKDVAFLQSMVPSIRRTRRANIEDIARMRRIAQNAIRFQQGKVDGMANGNARDFARSWFAYKAAVPDSSVTYDDWVAKIPTYGADGRRK